MDLGFAMGDGFEQAMGITFGVGDIGNYFGEDIFGQFMGGSVPGFDGGLHWAKQSKAELSCNSGPSSN
ncbi:hypothetical protein EYC80_006198 [Monilinia laxa]|nr:hypothetical protein EYC80_006198 [Monilinia laxa]